MIYDYLVVGAGLFGAVFAHEAHKNGFSVLVIDRRNHIAGNIYTENKDGIIVHMYGAHIFHTNKAKIWNYARQFADFNDYRHKIVANYKGEIYSLPFNMYTFDKLWGVQTEEDVRNKIDEQTQKCDLGMDTVEGFAIKRLGYDVYERMIKGYTEKQWGRECSKLPASIINRVPIRYTYDDNYFNDIYQGIPEDGYTSMVARMLENIDLQLGTDYISNMNYFHKRARKIVYTGSIDSYYQYVYGKLQYRSLYFEHEKMNTSNFQGRAVVNYTDKETPWTRIIEHKWFSSKESKGTIITREYPRICEMSEEPFYPINDIKNNDRYAKYYRLAHKDVKVIFGGRLGEYRYYNMDQVIDSALQKWEMEIRERR